MTDIVDKTLDDLEYAKRWVPPGEKSKVTNAIKLIEQLTMLQKGHLKANDKLIDQIDELQEKYDNLQSENERLEILSKDFEFRGLVLSHDVIVAMLEYENIQLQEKYATAIATGKGIVLDELKRFIKTNDLRDEPLNSPIKFGSRS